MRTASELDWFLCKELNGSPVIFTDDSYSLPTRDWVVKDLGDAYRKTLFDNGLGYKKNIFDCDDFSLLNYWACLTTLVITRLKTRESGGLPLAVGICIYKRDDGQCHAIILAIVKEKDELAIVFVEPQNSNEITLSDEEKTSITNIWM